MPEQVVPECNPGLQGKVKFLPIWPARLASAAKSAFGKEGESMIIVIGAVTAQQASFDELRRLAQQHVERSRGEPGCVSHAMSLDSENPLRLVFVEEWADLPALQAHFAVPESRAFAAAAARLGHSAELRIFDAQPVRATA